jgi:hypothetical protein
MTDMSNSSDFQTIPGVGRSIAEDLRRLGLTTVQDLVGQDLHELYERSNLDRGARQDRCLLYVIRCAVYYAECGREPDKLKWWNWKDHIQP